MALLGKLAFLWATTLISAQILYDHQENDTGINPAFDYAKIAKLLQAPLFRNDPAGASAEAVSSYLPQNYDIVEPKQINDDLKGTDYLPLVLQPPKPEAENVYVLLSKAMEPELKTYQAQPSIQFQPPYVLTNPYSKQLDIPLPNTSQKNVDYPLVPSTELQLPIFEPFNQQFNPNLQHYTPQQQFLPQQQLIQQQQYSSPNGFTKSLDAPYPTLSQTLELPKAESIKIQNLPTSTFPKKYDSKVHDYKPKKFGKNIPVIEIVGDEVIDVSNVKKSSKSQKFLVEPVVQEADNDNVNKQRQKFEEVQKKLKLKKENEPNKQQRFIDATIARASGGKGEQEASETGFNSFQHTGAHFAAPTQHNPIVGLGDATHDVGGDRTEFQMYGQHGPHSYKFGYDTGKGKNRQFRFEERDNDGYVKGHYGFYDKHGKLQVVNYDAHPHHGFHAEGSFGKV